MGESISVAVMLARMEITTHDGAPVVFDLVFVKENGAIRKMTAQNHVKHSRISDTPAPTGKFRYNLKNKRSVLLFDVHLKEYRSVKIDRILHFNNLIVQH